jgi:hypothetical protein
MLIPRIIFGFHGCDESVVRMVLDGGALLPSTNAWDWLGHGIYFWEDSPARAMLWAEETSRQPGSNIKTPAILGAIIDFGHCLNLTDPDNAGMVQAAYDFHVRASAEAGVPMARNKGRESKARFLDCAVMNLLHTLNERQGLSPTTPSAASLWRVLRSILPPACAVSITSRSASATRTTFSDSSARMRRGPGSGFACSSSAAPNPAFTTFA